MCAGALFFVLSILSQSQSVTSHMTKGSSSLKNKH